MKRRYALFGLMPVVTCVTIGVVPIASGQTRTEAWPTRPIRLVLPFPPGGATDANARVIAKEVENVLGQPLVIDNRGGANAIIGSDIVAKAAPDGYTLMHISVAFAINPSHLQEAAFRYQPRFHADHEPDRGTGLAARRQSDRCRRNRSPN